MAFALRPRLPRGAERRDRDYVLVVDASQSMVGERFARASELASRVVGELDRRDRFTVLACDYTCRAMPGGLAAPSARSAQDAAGWLGSIEPAGASDLVASLREAVASAEGERRDGRELHLIYVGDGVSTAGYRRASSLSAEVSELARASHVVVSTVGVGGDADTLALSAIARASGGHYVPYVPGQRTSVAALSVLETTYGVSLESPRVELPEGLAESAPTVLPTIRAGQEVVLVARMARDQVNGDVVLRGTVAGRPFEQRYPVRLVPTDAAGNGFVPRLWAAGQIDELQLRGRGDERARIVAISRAFGVMSRHTSLLVLESEAMFRAFRVDRNTAAPAWTGEEDVVTGGAEGALVVDGHEGDGAGGLAGLGVIGTGRGGGGSGYGSGAGETRGRMARSAPSSPAGGAPVDDMVGARGPAPAARPSRADAPREESEASADRAQRDWRWNDMPTPQGQQRAAAVTAAEAPPPPPMQPRQPGRWMRRVWYRVGEVQPSSDVGTAEREAARRAEEALRASPDSRDRHREAVRQLSRAGELTRALEVTEAWIERDRTDAEALTAKADLLGRLGRRDDALRVLTGTVDLSPNSEALHLRLARAFERAGRPERACAHRIALAEIDESDPAALALAMRCERELGREQAADRLMSGVRDPNVRTRAERAAQAEDEARRFRGDFTIEGSWDGDADLDLSIVTSQGTRLSWMGGRTTVVGEDARRPGGERLGIRFTGAGTYYVEVSRTDPADTRIVRGELRVRVLGELRTVPFTLTRERATVARVRVTRESRLEQVTGTVGPGWR
ncbi:MAG: VWA domain-containing protein [Sandaracinaceae bacterium]|nr:VWA domain-containing protein [Sandaracinaceae bacterium]